MRFIIGLIFGAGMIVLASQAQPPQGRWLERLPAWLDGVAGTAGDWLGLPPRPAPGRQTAAAAAAAGSLPDAVPPPLTAGVEPARQPIPRPPDPPRADLAPVRAPVADTRQSRGGEDAGRMAAEFSAGTAEAAGDAAAGTAAAGTAAAGTAASGTAAGIAAGGASAGTAAGGTFAGTAAAEPAAGSAAGSGLAAPGRATVWVPFHSRMSADGFAGRLSESLDHPFRVQRQGPGRYQVVFAYADESQRQALLDQASSVTGLPL